MNDEEIGCVMTNMLRAQLRTESTSELRRELRTYERDAANEGLPAWGRENARTLAREIRAELERRSHG